MILTGSEWDHVTHYSRETVVLQSVHRYVIITNNYHFLCLGDLILFFNIELKNLHEWKKSRKHMLNVKEYNMKNVNYYLFFFWKYHFVCYCLCQIFTKWERQWNVKYSYLFCYCWCFILHIVQFCIWQAI